MTELMHENITRLKKTAEIASALFIFTIASIIIFNTLKFSSESDLSFSNQAFKHLVEDHKVNNMNFGFIKIDLHQKNYFEMESASLINAAAATVLFLISYSIIFYSRSGRKLFFAEKFLFTTGFKNSSYRPPQDFS